jgi:hypothetical protein
MTYYGIGALCVCLAPLAIAIIGSIRGGGFWLK